MPFLHLGKEPPETPQLFLDTAHDIYNTQLFRYTLLIQDMFFLEFWKSVLSFKSFGPCKEYAT
jgi:hypothetical protein